MDRDKAYQVLSDLVFKGFIVAEMNIDSRFFIFKTINDKEYDLIRVYAGSPDTKGYQVRFNAYSLAFSLFILDGQNVLVNRENRITDLYNFFIRFPEKLFSKILNNLNDLRMEAFESIKFLEGFSYTELSRNYWKSLNNNLLSSPAITGIAGTDAIGLNALQENWILINRLLDEEEVFNRNFSMALMITSATNPKGARQIRNRHESSLKMAEDRRTKIAKLGFIDSKKWSPDGWAAPVDTAEELVAELERQMAGIKDKHDIFIENYLKKMREQAEKRAQEAEQHMRESMKEHEFFIDGSQRVLTPEESEKLKSRKNPLLQCVSDEAVTAEDKERFYKKIGARVLTGK